MFFSYNYVYITLVGKKKKKKKTKGTKLTSSPGSLGTIAVVGRPLFSPLPSARGLPLPKPYNIVSPAAFLSLSLSLSLFCVLCKSGVQLSQKCV